MSEKKVVMRIRALHKRFGAQSVLQGIDLDIYAGEKIAIIGGSGSGKSTLLRCLNFMEIPSAGTVELDGVTLGKIDSRGQRRYSEKQLSDVRQRVGMVFQQFNLFPHLTVLQNCQRSPDIGEKDASRRGDTHCPRAAGKSGAGP
ncbi:cystine ABC transporter [Klebsiella michiganensis]|uniref:Cystine ABC transporter n=1 Tax=Klebsiella michiganensis TaxID=1134687 RepID=A0A7H4N250_9ENTR|nr:cystine ABC transporter [Klebsiella michiganensis]